MAAVLYLADDEIERECKRMRVFRDRNNPLEVLNDIEVIERYRLPRNVLIRLNFPRMMVAHHLLPSPQGD